MRKPAELLCLLIWPFAGALVGCASRPQPLAAGPGLVSHDRTPPADAATFARPDLLVGDRFVFRRGGQERIAVRVSAIEEDAVEFTDEDRGMVNRFDRDFGAVELRDAAGATITRWDRVDARFHWPLWVGKRWTAQYVRRDEDGEVPVLAEYSCEGRETITVLAGSFDALRILRRSRPLLDGEWLERVDVLWYAPLVGQVVRRIEDSVLTELEAAHRQGAPIEAR
ncbi:MAG: hypothetical protein AB7I19_15185 [Planctomycetota bacterium]